MYTTYEFYEKTYYGDVLTEQSFPKWNARAADALNWITCGNLKGHIEVVDDEVSSDFDPDVTTAVQMAACAVADKLFIIDAAARTANSQDEGNIKSKSSGNESVSYAASETDITKAVADPKVKRMLLYSTASEYLSGTGLLYWGM